jgi:hypothetical protein
MARSLAERLRAHEQQKARLAEQEAKLKDDERKARTRRLIQAGGLIEKAGLLIERVGAKSGRQNITGRLGRGRRTTRRRGDRCPRAAGAPSEALHIRCGNIPSASPLRDLLHRSSLPSHRHKRYDTSSRFPSCWTRSRGPARIPQFKLPDRCPKARPYCADQSRFMVCETTRVRQGKR